MKNKKQLPKSNLNCEYCGKEFKYESEKKRHEQSHSPQFECKVCSKKFSFISAVRRHEKQHERTGYVVCNECNKKFRDETLLKRHIQYAHKGTFTCSKCNSTFSSELALRCHSKTHRPVAERKYQCSYQGCKKSFNFAHHLKHHELTHTDMKQHFCNVCGKGFIQSHHLKSHKKTHEIKNQFFCDYPGCKKTFITENERNIHFAKHDVTMKSEEMASDVTSSCDMTTEPDTVNCSSCNQVLLRHQYSDHILNCVMKNELQVSKPSIEDSRLTKLEPVKLDLSDANTCKSFVGGCIIGINTNIDGKCVCAQISAVLPTEDCLDLTTTEDVKFKMVDKDITKPNINNKIDDACEGCDCASYKSQTFMNRPSYIIDELPEIEYRRDGTIRIKETFDLDMAANKKCTEVVPYNSCKDVLGNCIVSGNGTIGEGCLCARMAMDDQPITAQEIEELTPCPKKV